MIELLAQPVSLDGVRALLDAIVGPVFVEYGGMVIKEPDGYLAYRPGVETKPTDQGRADLQQTLDHPY